MYNWRKDIVTWRMRDTLYISMPFTWLVQDASEIARAHKGRVIVGGAGAVLMKPDWADEIIRDGPFDVMAFYNPMATRTTRGCDRGCEFCAVAEIEGPFRELQEWRAAPIICDSSFLSSSKSHFDRVIERLKRFNYVDFQGIDARHVTPSIARRFTELRHVKIRMGFDCMNDERAVAAAIQTFHHVGIKNIGIYVLIGFDDSPEEARYKLETVRGWGIRPTPMRYQPLDCTKKNSYIALGWTNTELKRMVRYYSRLRYLEHIPYEDFDYLKSQINQTELALQEKT